MNPSIKSSPLQFRAREGSQGRRRSGLAGWICSITTLLIGIAPFVLAKAQTAPDSSSLIDHLRLGQQALKANDRSRAVQQFQAALEIDPSNPEAHANLGMLAFFSGDCRTAEPDFRSALQKAPSLVQVQALLGVCERRLGEPGAEKDMKAGFTNLQDVKLRTQVGIELADFYYQQQQDLGKTATVLYTLSTLNPDNVDILFFEQRVYSEIADSALDKLALLAPDSARMEQLIAEKLINAGDLKNAIIHYRNALSKTPKLAGVHFELAEALMEGSPNDPKVQQEATAELTSALQTDGDSAKIECELGRIASLQGDQSAALVHYQKAYQLSPGDAVAGIGIADVLATQGKPEEAAKYLREAVDADPLNAEAHYKLSQVDKQLSLLDDAKKQLQLFQDIRSSKAKVQQLYQQMKPQ